MSSKKIFGYLPALLIAALLLAACAPGVEEEAPTFPEAGTPFLGETQVLLPTGPLDGTPADPLDSTPMVTAEPGDGTLVVPVTPKGTEAPGTEAPGTEAPRTGGPPSSSGAIIQPETGRAELTRLSALIGYQVIDWDGQTLGMANDFILNLCEAHLLYIVLDADPALELQGGAQALIPYEMVSLHSGTLNSQERTIQLNLALSDVQTAPTMDRETFDVTTNEWEAEVQGFWTTHGNLSLTTECRVPGTTTGTVGAADVNCTGANPHPKGQELAQKYGVEYDEIMGWFCQRYGFGEIDWAYELSQANDLAVENIFSLRSSGMGWSNIRNAVAEGNVPAAPQPVQDRVTLHKNAFASDVLGAAVVDGNGQRLGTVEEVILEPESGRLTFAAVRLSADLQSGQNVVLVPFGALNLEDVAGITDGITLVLLVEKEVLTGAPQAASLPAPADTGLESQSLDYWGQYVPLTRDQLP